MQWYGRQYELLEYPDHTPRIDDLYVAETIGFADNDGFLQQYKASFSTPGLLRLGTYQNQHGECSTLRNTIS